ncbi:ricin B lectin [Marasmius fiardii PR-910]|nr:ricin B lectin [Marasmius fiardii PR-910]
MRAAFSLLAFVTVATASQLQSNNPSFPPGATGCISASNAVGAPVTIESCIASGDISGQNWTFTQNGVPQQLSILGGSLCLDVINGVNTNGTRLQVFTCTPGNTNQLWIPLSNSLFQWAGTDKCIDLTDGNVNPGTQLQVWTCDPLNSNQHWPTFSPPPTGTTNRIRALGAPSPTVAQCLVASANANGAALSLDVCGSPAAGANDTWVLPASGTGPISTFNGAICLDVTNGNSTNGNLVQAWSCAAENTNQMWSITGPAELRTISWVGQNKCLNVRDGVFVPGTSQIQIWDCDPSNLDPNQHWVLQ